MFGGFLLKELATLGSIHNVLSPHPLIGWRLTACKNLFPVTCGHKDYLRLRLKQGFKPSWTLNSLSQKCNISCAMRCFEPEQINPKRKKMSISFPFFQAPVLNIPAQYLLVYLLAIRKIHQGYNIQPRHLQ